MLLPSPLVDAGRDAQRANRPAAETGRRAADAAARRRCQTAFVGPGGLRHEGMTVPRIPSVPRLPYLPDPLRRVHIPRDLESVTAIGQEQEAGAGGMSGESVERIWSAAVDLYRSGVHPAVQVCVRRQGAVVLDRAIGHARGNGPHDGPEVKKEL